MSFKTANLLDEKGTLAFNHLLKQDINDWYSKWFFCGKPKITIETNQRLFDELACDDGYEIVNHHQLILLSKAKSYKRDLFCYACDFEKNKVNKTDSVIINNYIEKIFQDLYSTLNVDKETEKIEPQIFSKIRLTIDTSEFVLHVTSSFIDKFFMDKRRTINLKPFNLISVIDSKVDIDINLLTNEINIQSIMGLKKGDVIKLNQQIKEPIKIKVNQIQSSIGSFVVSKNNQKAIIVAE